MILLYVQESEEIICLSQTELNKRYYLEDDIYYKCIVNCDTYNNVEAREQCFSGFEVVNGKYINQIENCEKYDNEGICSKCLDNFLFKEDDKTIFLEITKFKINVTHIN